MKTLCWNVRGLGNPRALAALKKVLRSSSPDLVFLCETRLRGVWAEQIKRKLGFENGFHVNCEGKSGGLILLWNNLWDVEIKSFSKSHIDSFVRMDDGNCWRFTGLYGCPHQNLRRDFWELLKRLKMGSSLPWLCGGDLNEILVSSEKLGGTNRLVSGMNDFRNALDFCNLDDLGFRGPLFTWSNKRVEAANVQERLDRFLANQQWKYLFPGALVENLDFLFSDHRPILLNLQGSRRSKAVRSFKFESFWLKDDSCHQVVRNSWNAGVDGNSAEDIRRKLKSCASHLEVWSRSIFGSLRKSISEKLEALNLLLAGVQSVSSAEKIKVLEKELSSLLAKEELYWQQRARTDWMISGDKNTKFFHARATARKRKNEILKLVDEFGVCHEDDEGIANTVSNYFSSLFKSSSPSVQDLEEASCNIKNRFSEDMVCLRILNGFESVKSLNHTNIVLIPKKGSGQLVNFQKFAITFSPNVLSGCKDSIQIIFDLARSQSHDRYLGLPTLVKSAESLLDHAGFYLAEFQNTLASVSPLVPRPVCSGSVGWSPPPCGSLKLNCDAAVRIDKNFIGVGAAIRDSSGHVVVASSHLLSGFFSPKIGEFLALTEGLLLASHHSLQVSLIETDASNVAAGVLSKSVCLGPAGAIVNDIKVLCKVVGVSSWLICLLPLLCPLWRIMFGLM
ncbi:hypothetical protein ACOSQ4_017450 [Xanthoceras sorbifolium]